MPIGPQDVAAAVGRGLSIICATCQKYWQARDNQVPGDRCTSSGGCGSPIAGDTFHEYDGPITQFDRWCFVCGDIATHALRVKTHVRVIGCCERHLELVKTLKAQERPPITIVIVKDGKESSSEEVEKKAPSLKIRSG